MKRNLFLIIVMLILLPASQAMGKTTRQERRAIISGNEQYAKGNFQAAAKDYQKALSENTNSQEAAYNLGLTRIKMSENAKDENTKKELLENGLKQMEVTASLGAANPKLAAYANFNMGNVAFKSGDYATAINYYKQSLRFNPDYDNARKNLRIAQLKQQQNQQKKDNKDNKDQNKDQNKDDKKDQDKDQNKDQNKDKQDKQNEQKDKQNQQQDKMNSQTANQILNAVENKENGTRARLLKAGKGNEQRGSGRRLKNW